MIECSNNVTTMIQILKSHYRDDIRLNESISKCRLILIIYKQIPLNWNEVYPKELIIISKNSIYKNHDLNLIRIADILSVPKY